MEDLLKIGLDELASDTLYCISYNVNLDYVLSLFNSFSYLNRVVIYANSEMITHSGKNTDQIVSLIKKGVLRIHHTSSNRLLIHSKAYAFHKEEICVLAGIGSPNLSSKSNQSFEVLTIFRNPVPDPIISIWNQIPSLTGGILQFTKDPPPFIFKSPPSVLFDIDPNIIEGFWEHQKIIMDWLSSRGRSIVNIPPGTGKTKIALAYARHLIESKTDLTTIILVPTKTLIGQWISILEEVGFEVYEGGTEASSFTDYLGAPEGRFLVTLYNRFWENSDYIIRELSIIKVPCLLIADECHHLYSRLEDLFRDTLNFENGGMEYHHIGLSATIDTFYENLKEDYLSYCGGPDSQFCIELAPFYSLWNDINDRPILKEIEYIPVLCKLSNQEMERFKQLSKYIAIQSAGVGPNGEIMGSAAVQRARFVRETESGIRSLRLLLDQAIPLINEQSSLIFVQKNSIAVEIRNYITNHNLWDRDASAYIYDSHQRQKYLDYAMDRFKANKGFCLIAERMIAEGFDLPSISLVILHGSHRSERDWIQKVGRAIRFDPNNPNDFARVLDVVFCDPNGNILEMEQERYNTLTAISRR